METGILPIIAQLGVAAFAIYIMYQMYLKTDARLAQKDEVVLDEVRQHRKTLLAHQLYVQEAHNSTLVQLSHASKVIQENVKAYERVINYMDKQK